MVVARVELKRHRPGRDPSQIDRPGHEKRVHTSVIVRIVVPGIAIRHSNHARTECEAAAALIALLSNPGVFGHKRPALERRRAARGHQGIVDRKVERAGERVVRPRGREGRPFRGGQAHVLGKHLKCDCVKVLLHEHARRNQIGGRVRHDAVIHEDEVFREPWQVHREVNRHHRTGNRHRRRRDVNLLDSHARRRRDHPNHTSALADRLVEGHHEIGLVVDAGGIRGRGERDDLRALIIENLNRCSGGSEGIGRSEDRDELRPVGICVVDRGDRKGHR